MLDRELSAPFPRILRPKNVTLPNKIRPFHSRSPHISLSFPRFRTYIHKMCDGWFD